MSRDPIEEQGGWNLYAMIDNDSINFWDWLGLEEHPSSWYNQYDNPTYAVRKRGRHINPRSISENREYCGHVCKVCVNRAYKYFTTQTSGTEAGCSPSNAPCPSDSISVAIWHTHGGFVDRVNNTTGDNTPDGIDDYDSENYSDTDTQYSERRKQDIYIITPDNKFKQYVPDGRGGTTINRGSL
jgi:hypothetical protein